MSGNSTNFNNKKIKISDFYKNKNTKIFNIDEIDVNKILVSKKEPYSAKGEFKYSIGYIDNEIIKPLYLGLPQMNGYIKKSKYKKTKITTTMYFTVKYKQLYNEIWEKIDNKIKNKNKNKRRIILMRILNQIVTLAMKQNQIVTLMMKQNLTLIMMNKFK